LNDDPGLSAYQTLPEPIPSGINRTYVTADPTKLLVATTGLARSGAASRRGAAEVYRLPIGPSRHLHVHVS
jgi:hypothetical protein